MLSSAEAAYGDPGQHAPMVFMASGGEFHDGNAAYWAYQKQPSFPSSTYSDNTKWETAAMFMGVDKDAIRKATGKFNAPLEFWGFTNSPRYHAERFYTYRN